MPLQIVATDSQPGRTLTYNATGLPPGLSINSGSGVISGTPNTPGNYNVNVTATDNVGITGSAGFPWVVNSLVQGTKGLVGAIVHTSAYGSTYTQQATTFDSRVGRPLAATVWKSYVPNVSEYQTSLNSPAPIGEAAALGAKVLVDVKPAVDPTGAYTSSTYAAEAQKLAAMIQLLVNNNINFETLFYNEINLKKYGFTPSTWLPFWQFYAPVVIQNGGRPSWCVTINAFAPTPVNFFPTNPFPNKAYCDWYSNDFLKGGITPITNGIQAICDQNNIPLGLGEFGPTNDSAHFIPTTAQWNTFCTDQILGIFGANPTPSYPAFGSPGYVTGSQRLAAGKVNADVLYYSNSSSTTTPGYVTSSSDWKVPGIQAVYDALNA